MRSALLQRGNSLAALGREADARKTYEDIFPILEGEPRCARVDWERHSLHVNIGNTYAREGNYDKADEYYKIAEKLGHDHIEAEEGSDADGRTMVLSAMRARSIALKKVGRDNEAKTIMADVVKRKIEDDSIAAKKKAEQAAETGEDVANAD